MKNLRFIGLLALVMALAFGIAFVACSSGSDKEDPPPQTYTETNTITGKDGLDATATRNVRIVAPNEKKDPRAKYGLSGQAKAGSKVTHTGITSGAIGFMDLQVSSIDKNMSITAQLIDTATKQAIVTDTFTAVGTKQYRIDQSKYELIVAVNQANGNSKYSINLTMPETAVSYYFSENEVPLSFITPPKIAYIGSNHIVLHQDSATPYFEQGARAVDYLIRLIDLGKADITRSGIYDK